jgi:pyruvate-formate lyase-activating enzyme
MGAAQVVFFGAGGYAETVFAELNGSYAPVAYGDNDPKKQGTRFMGLPVLSLGEIEAGYPGCRFYLTVDVQAKPYVTESLVTRGVDASRIINFEKYNRYKSCWQLERCMYYFLSQFERALTFCCSDFGKNFPDRVSICNGAHDETMRNFYVTLDRIIEELNAPAETPAQNACVGCRNAKDGLWRNDRRISLMNFRPPSICNFKCSYCKSRDETLDASFSVDMEEALSFLRFVKEKRIIDADTAIHFAAGEISVHPLRDKILAELQEHCCWIYTNASVYNDAIGKMLSKGKSRVYPSIDAGSRETFAKIKGVDLFDKVCENLRRYSLDGLVHLKYIVLPSVNDNEANVEGFIDLCGRLKIGVVDVVRDFHNMGAYGDSTIEMAARMLDGLQKIGVKASLSENAFDATSPDKLLIEERLAELGAADSPRRPPPQSGGGGW